MRAYVLACVRVCVCVCACAHEREREREGNTDREYEYESLILFKLVHLWILLPNSPDDFVHKLFGTVKAAMMMMS